MISATILTKNSEKHLDKVLSALKTFDEVVITDDGSTDSTLKIASRYPNVSIYQSKLSGFGPRHNEAIDLAKNAWILSIDSDEILSPEAVEEIANCSLDPQTIYTFPIDNYFNGKHITSCGWYPDRKLRLFNRNSTRFTNDMVHEKVIAKDLKLHDLRSSIIHYSYESISDFLRKMQNYSDLFAEQNKGKKDSSLLKALAHGVFAFIKSYFIKVGLKDGYEGFVISLYNAHTAYYKYLKLYEANSKIDQCS